MRTTQSKPFDYDIDLMLADMAGRGWMPTDLAAKARVSDMTVSRFFSNDATKARRTPKTARKLARALGHDAERYLLRLTRTAVPA